MRARAVAVLLAPALLVTLGPGPATPASAGGATADRAGAAPERVQFIEDPRGDVQRVRRSDPQRAVLDDLLSVRYQTPSRVGTDDLVITTRWADLRDGSRRGAPRQDLWIELRDRVGRGSWTIYADNVRDRVTVEDFTGDEETSIVVPRQVGVYRTFGKNGRMNIVLSSEWLGRVASVAFRTWGGGRGGGPSDPTARSRYLAVGERG